MVIWGMSWSSAKVLSAYATAPTLVFIRFCFVVLTLIPVLFFLRIDFKPRIKSSPYLLGVTFFISAYSLLFFSGVKSGFAGAGGVLVTTINPVFAYLIGVIVSQRIPNKREIIGLCLGLSGGLILLQIWQKTDVVLQIGNIYFVLAALFWAIMSKINSFGARHANPFNFIFWVNVFSAMAFSVFVDYGELNFLLEEGDSVFWSNMIYMGVINSGGATVCFLYATTQIGAEKASSFNYLVPACALIGSVIFLGEEVQWFTIVGGMVAVSAVILLNRKKSL